MSKVIFITGAGRGLGTDIAREALKAGHQVVATGRRPEKVLDILGGEQDNLLVTALDVTDVDSSQAAVQAAVDRFGRIDTLINNAGSVYAGYFETLSTDQIRQQFETNVFGPMNVVRAVLPVLRRQRDGHIVNISSIAGLVGWETTGIYSSSKHAVEGWTESLKAEVEPYGVRVTLVEPGYFRTQLMEDSSTTWSGVAIEDYAERSAAAQAAFRSMNGKQPGDPAKLARTLVTLAEQDQPPLRFVAGADAIPLAEDKARQLLAQAEASRELGMDLAHDDA
ncbi:SDR family oxidoreductase [Streptomyces fractus]|uniref:SDR family oxidoreductase n=1 Tax=Streptomyces fractus TaxID=641806 RepID=UPI003CEF42E1